MEPEVKTAPPRRRRPRRWWIGRTVMVVLALLVAYVIVTFVQVDRASTHDGRRLADAIIVLGAAQYHGQPSPVLRERLDHALDLYEEGLAPVIVLTGGKQAADTFTEATTGYNYLRNRGVPDEALLKEVDGTSTWDSLQATHRFLSERGAERVVLVTDDYHAYRVEAIAEEIGFDASVSPSDSLLDGTGKLRQLMRETLAVSVGRIIGYDRLFRIDHDLND
jgi:vancomycin permeability regulator SanA